ncbi:MAG TPA: LacI family transcriptional regulator [Gammaproteobacteria bacterium]|jgi:LacI family transcriptional regulator|nr:LacI family DNA-binding transcriptional regulator [Arenicellales bacterium]MDP6792007.1 LacI family DNA-binding transcriptional regulator [Arenicellales bacterium]MDP7065891.1 LacI family DNA-binding transcriptional regulator [Arenicellales bacterium]HCX88472.1 LacI family transcriptional regulator [Gammaproteobacteria bacterium]|tara:strand:+ start:1804 stop:2799 length:996 start_codon:yes stop_codon:yes gene_type:complete
MQVAKAADVSTATVSRCLSNPEIVRPSVRARVESAVEVLGYTPDAAARTLVTQRSATIGVIVPTLELASFARGIQSLQRRLDESQYTPLLTISNFDKAEELRHARNLVSRGVDGVMLVGLDHDPKLYTLLEKYNIPFVTTWGFDPKSAVPCVGFDNRGAMRRITDYVLSMGHRNVAMIVGGMWQINDRSRERPAGFRDSLKHGKCEIPEERIVEVPFSMDSAQAALRQLMIGENPPSAIVCGSDLLAIGAILECRRMGIEVPADLSITGFDDLEIAAHFNPGLTTVDIPAEKMGVKAAEYLIDRINGISGPEQIELDYKLVLRESVISVRN